MEDIIARYGQALARVAASYEADPALREDLLQDILLAVHQALPRLERADSLAPFLFRIAHNRGVSHIVRRVAAKRADRSGEEPAEAADPETLLQSAERSQLLAAAIRRLPLPYRQVLTLLLEELSYAEIAETLGISVSNVGVRVNRAKVRLRELLDGGR
ncbi:MAG: RNA polymerase sigma factor [Allosphingosinicella sp.]|uniref:RNA polymerase sigma factor n=1 Tax=Allosphingosinicella sp. TaxID=2823234 RepID=UPI00391FF06E